MAEFFLPPALYTQDMSKKSKSFLSMSLLYMPDKVWLSFCKNTVNLHFCGSIVVHHHNFICGYAKMIKYIK